jgi:hypothetical protein
MQRQEYRAPTYTDGGMRSNRIAVILRVVEMISFLPSLQFDPTSHTLTIAGNGKNSDVGRSLRGPLRPGNIEMKYDNRADGRTRLAAVEKEAAWSGFALIARKGGSGRKSIRN